MGKTQNLNLLWPTHVGFDRFFQDIERALNTQEQVSTFPPHNIIKVDDNKYLVELAIAGFSKEDISIAVTDNVLEITGMKNLANAKEINYLHKGIGTRSFVKKLQLAEHTEVQGAQFKDGILTIGLENIIPEEKKPKIVEIDDGFIPSYTPDRKQLLNE